MSGSGSRMRHGDASDGDAPTTSVLGTSVARRDGPAKVRGAAVYAAEYRPSGLVHAVTGAKHDPRGTGARDRHRGGRDCPPGCCSC